MWQIPLLVSVGWKSFFWMSTCIVSDTKKQYIAIVSQLHVLPRRSKGACREFTDKEWWFVRAVLLYKETSCKKLLKEVSFFRAVNAIFGKVLRIATEDTGAFADRRGYLIISLSRITTWPTWSLQLSEINNIMYAVKTLHIAFDFHQVHADTAVRSGCMSSHCCRHAFTRVYSDSIVDEVI